MCPGAASPSCAYAIPPVPNMKMEKNMSPMIYFEYLNKEIWINSVKDEAGEEQNREPGKGHEYALFRF